MVWKKLNNAHFGSSTTFGGADIDKISKVFDGTLDIDEQDINSSTTIRSNKFKFRNLADTYSYTVTPSAIAADRTATLPALANDSEFLFENASQTISNKTLSNCSINGPTFINMNTEGCIQDPIIKRWGSYTPVGGSTLSTRAVGDGILRAHTTFSDSGSGTSVVGHNTSQGLYAEYQTAAIQGDLIGLRPAAASSIGPIRMARAGKMRLKMSTYNFGVPVGAQTFSCGLFDYKDPPAWAQSGASELDNHSGFVIHLGGPWISLQYNNGLSTCIFDVINTDAYNFAITPRWYEVNWSAGGSDITMNFQQSGVGPLTASLPSRLPSPTTNLWPWCYMSTNTAVARSFRLYGWWIEVS